MKRLLVANRGEIARRIIRTAHAMGITTVAVYSDADAQAMHVREATVAVCLGGNASADSYLRADKLIGAARAAGADAVHPGYGFLSENPDFAQAVIDAGLNWVGPPPAAIRALGNKSSAKQLAVSRNLPCLPGYQGNDQSDERFVQEAARIGYPLMVKATAGGGGRGMRLVTQSGELPDALQSARSEAQSGFGNSELLIERALAQPRHVEVQVFADAHGHCIHLGERDCSVQRRHQKIIEESPSPAVDADLRARMGACAVELALAAGYVGAGTVEFLLDGEASSRCVPRSGGADFYLMEMNTRLQVEHPVTELLTGLDLVEWQLRIARGEALPLTQAQVQFNGHAIEVRLCAEDEDYTPHSGRVRQFAAPPVGHVGLRMDHAIENGTRVPPYYDSMLGKLIAHAATREQAIDRLLEGLAQTRILGLPSNRAFLRASLAHSQFRAGHALIPFLAQQSHAVRDALQDVERDVLVPAALAVIFAATAEPGPLAPPFGRPVRLRHRNRSMPITVHERGHGHLQVELDGRTHSAQLSRLSSNSHQGIAIAVNGVHHIAHACQGEGARWHVQVGAIDLWLEDASFEPLAQGGQAQHTTELRAPFNGMVIRLAVQPGQSVVRGETLVVIESMKLEHASTAPRDAVVKATLVEAGQQVATGHLLLSFEPAAASSSAALS